MSQAPISPRYMLVEALTAGLTVLVALKYFGRLGDAWSLPRCIGSLFLLYPLVPVTFIDLKLKIIPDRITKPGMIVAVVLSLFIPDLHKPQMFSLMAMRNERMASLIVSLLGVLAGAGAPGTNYLIVGTDSRAGITPDNPNAGAMLDPGLAGERTDTVVVLRRSAEGLPSCCSRAR